MIREYWWGARPSEPLCETVSEYVPPCAGVAMTSFSILSRILSPVCAAFSGWAGSSIQGKKVSPVCSRSEEHTSELQSLMRISYAVFCLKKKINNKNVKIATRTNKIKRRKQR